MVEGITKNSIYEGVSDYYKDKGLSSDDFTSRLRAIGRLLVYEESMSDAVHVLYRFQNDYLHIENKKEEQKVKSMYRYELQKCLGSMGLKSTKNGIVRI